MFYREFLNKKFFINFLFTIFFSIFIYYLISSKFIYFNFIPPMVKDGAIKLFADWSVIINANICDNKGFDVFIDNPCDLWGRRHVYGKILLYLPFIDNNKVFYLLVLPLLINILFLFIIINLIDYDLIKKFYISLAFIISPAVLLSIDRANIDILIFLTMVLIAKSKNYFVNNLLIFISTLSKFYPVFLSFLFIFSSNLKKIAFSYIIFLFLIFLILFFQQDELSKIFLSKQQFSASGGIFEFSFNGLLITFNNLINSQYNEVLNYFIFLTIILILVFFNYYVTFPLFKNTKELINIFNDNVYENRIFILSISVIIFCYFLFSNYLYREIFFLGLIPYIIKIKQDNNKKNWFLIILIFKFLITSLCIYTIRKNFLTEFHISFFGLKHLIDFNLILILLIIFFTSLYNVLKLRFLKLH